jgi:transcription elongation GreA/GreB family factor
MSAPSALWFMSADLEDLDATIDDVKQQIRAAKLEAQEGTEQSSESWHDNYVFEESQRQLRMLMNHLAGLSRTRERAILHDPETRPGIVGFGSCVRVRIDGHEDELHIGSAMVFDRMREQGHISYQSPLAATLLGHPAGTRVQALINNTPRTIDIVAVTP